ncbi:UDP-glucuronic acid decarboxylase family protein [Ancylobacter sp.]|uniref:UDP-glucuronic acid decarboxylase family protein n=1 Tax=Ancylobacter sp. TaxID=1872567 RepID=UPI003D10F652
MARVLVSGGGGFLGSLLCGKIVKSGNEVVCVDNFSTGSQSNIDDLRDNPKFKLIEQDVCSPLDGEFDEIFNLACPASPVHYQRDPVQTTRTCVLGALNVLDSARRSGAKVLQASTSEVYGDPLIHPQQESYWGNVNPHGLRACYDEGKRCAESLFADYHRQYGVRIRVARIFNTYGPRMQPADGRVISTFIIQALQQRDITVTGAGAQTRSFCYRDDLIDGLLRLMAAPDSVFTPVNLGNPVEITVRALAQRIIDLVGARSKIVSTPLPQDDPQRRCPDVSRARELLDWKATTDLDDGLRATIAYFDDLLAGRTRMLDAPHIVATS